ncbi:hypothetical protein DFH07DRAFT_854172 [Mycena maculata]|uniref:Uncharacterized protein n=1 Tax=Mycena maculata TaxID=230809 RepID=A0AAD7HPC6_9AGAR|nr:hypothetical protein DFH07DRAFT_854172 [Mycena maculata]
MPNPVDDAPAAPGEIVLPCDPVPDPGLGARLRTFRRRVLYVSVVCFALALVVLWEHPPTAKRPIEELADGLANIAEDPRLEPYQTLENAEYCAEWELGSHGNASVSFELPTDADLLFFLSRGPSSGHINVIKGAETGPVQVNVTALYDDTEDLERTKVCRMGYAQEHGILIWAEPRHPHGDPRHDVQPTITVALPTNHSNFRDFTTDLALFSHHFDSFWDFFSGISFMAIRLKTSNAPIRYLGLIARALFIQTSNANIQGLFVGTDVFMQTSNAPIKLFALLFGESVGAESRAQIKTSNGAIETSLIMGSDYVDNVFRVLVETSAAPLTVNKPTGYGVDKRLSQMVESMEYYNMSFFLDASTTLGPAIVKISPEYEGTYDLQTTRSQAHVNETTDIHDPSGKGRHRTVNRTSEGGQQAEGFVYWSDDRDGEPPEGVARGAVKVTTTESPVTLYC